MPMSPISKNWWMMSLRKTPASSISRTCGRICSRANLRTVDWKNFSSSLRAVSGAAATSLRSAVGMTEAYHRKMGTVPIFLSPLQLQIRRPFLRRLHHLVPRHRSSAIRGHAAENSRQRALDGGRRIVHRLARADAFDEILDIRDASAGERVVLL